MCDIYLWTAIVDKIRPEYERLFEPLLFWQDVCVLLPRVTKDVLSQCCILCVRAGFLEEKNVLKILLAAGHMGSPHQCHGWWWQCHRLTPTPQADTLVQEGFASDIDVPEQLKEFRGTSPFLKTDSTKEPDLSPLPELSRLWLWLGQTPPAYLSKNFTLKNVNF